MRRAAPLLAAALLAGCGGSSSSVTPTTASTAAIRQALVARLTAKKLDFRWVVCIRNGRSFEGTPIVRCNVNFGDPHIEAYCSVFRGGRLVTDHENPAIRCSHDDAGWDAPVVRS